MIIGPITTISKHFCHIPENEREQPVLDWNTSNVFHVFGPDLPGIKSKTVQRKTERVEAEDALVTRTITDDYHRFVSVTLTADVMFVNGLPFLVTISRRIRLITVKHTP